MTSAPFSRFGGTCAILTGIAGFLYAVAFLGISRSSPDTGRLFSAIFLLLAGLLSTAAFVALYERLREAAPGLALWALILGMIGAMGVTVHGGYDLALAIHPMGPSTDLPSPIDPRGLLTFGVSALSVFIFGWLIANSGALPRGLGSVAYVQALLLVVLYLGRLIILNPANPIIVLAAVLSGFIAGPIWYIWLGLALRRS